MTLTSVEHTERLIPSERREVTNIVVKRRKKGMVRSPQDFNTMFPEFAERMTFNQFMGNEPLGETSLLTTQTAYVRGEEVTIDSVVRGDSDYFVEWCHKGNRILFDKHGNLVTCAPIPLSKSWYARCDFGTVTLQYIPSVREQRLGLSSFIVNKDSFPTGSALEVHEVCSDTAGNPEVIKLIKKIILEEFDLS